MSKLHIEGVPRAVVVDGWWLSADASYTAPRGGSEIQKRWHQCAKNRVVLLVLLLAVADILFYRQAVGVSIAIFSVLIFIANVIEAQGKPITKGPVIVLVLSILPVIEYAQFVSILIAFLGLIVSISWFRIGYWGSIGIVLSAARRLALFIPIAAVGALIDWMRKPRTELKLSFFAKDILRNWAFPVGGGLMILSLLVMANPVLEHALNDLVDVNFDIKKFVARVLFWIGATILIWPLLIAPNERLDGPTAVTKPRQMRAWGLNANSVSNALWVFNSLLVLQLVMDGHSVFGGTLPYGVGYAEYAHRGAYPLVITAILAGLFALAARPFLAEGRLLKPLMMVWLLLNVMLTLSSIYRLNMYVDAYGLTYLRVRAGIWMVLIAFWLGLIAAQIIAEKKNGWLLLRSFGMGAITIYVCCFLNFAYIIAAFNAEHHRTSFRYTCRLGSTASAILLTAPKYKNCNVSRPHIKGWRDWGFREWRVARYVEQMRKLEVGYENSGR